MYRDPTMDVYGNYQAANLHAQTSQASPVQLVLMLVDGLLEELARLRMHIEQRRYEAKGRSIAKCVDILNGLHSALETGTGNEVVENLARLYEYCAERLHRAGIDMDAGIVGEVDQLLATLRTGWQGVAHAGA